MRVYECLNGDQRRGYARTDERCDHDRVPAVSWLCRDVGAAVAVPDPESVRPAQAETLARYGKHVAVDFPHLLTSARILGGERPRAGASVVVADVTDDENEQTARLIEASGGRGLAVRCV